MISFTRQPESQITLDGPLQTERKVAAQHFNDGRHIGDGTGWMFVVSVMPQPLSPRRGTPSRLEWEAGWPPQPIWALWRGGKSLAPVGSRSPARPDDIATPAVPVFFW